MSAEGPPRKKMKTREVCHCPCCPKFQEWRDTYSETFTLPKGEYYIGDLAHILSDDLYNELEEPGKFVLSDGREVVCFKFEGCQPERDNDIDFYVESGMIGITLLAGLEKDWQCPRSVLGGWGPHFNKLEELNKTLKPLKMKDYMEIAGTIVVYDADFECLQVTTSHYKHDDHSTTTSFGDKVYLWTKHGRYDTDEGSGSESGEEIESEEKVDND